MLIQVLRTMAAAPIALKKPPADPYPNYRVSVSKSHPFVKHFKQKAKERRTLAILPPWKPTLIIGEAFPFQNQFRARATEYQVTFLRNKLEKDSQQATIDKLDYEVLEHELDQTRAQLEDASRRYGGIEALERRCDGFDTDLKDLARKAEDLRVQLEAAGSIEQVSRDLEKLVIELKGWGVLGTTHLTAALGDEGAKRVVAKYKSLSEEENAM